MAKIKLPKKRDYLTLRSWFLEHKHLSAEEISRLSGITINKIREWMVYCDSVNVKDGELLKIWVNYKNYSCAEACVILGVTTEVFKKALNRNNIDRYRKKKKPKTTQPIKEKIKIPRNKDDFEKILEKHGIVKLSKLSGLSRQRIEYLKNKYGAVNTRTEKYSFKNGKYNTKQWLKEHYVDKKMSLRKCAEIAGVSPNTIRSRLISYGIIPRPPMTKNATLQAGIP